MQREKVTKSCTLRKHWTVLWQRAQERKEDDFWKSIEREEEKLKKVRQLRGCSAYLVWGGMLPKSLGQVLKMLVPKQGEDQVCTDKWGAKMGIGRNGKCGCPACLSKKVALKLVRKIQCTICEAAEEQWTMRNEKYKEYISS